MDGNVATIAAPVPYWLTSLTVNTYVVATS